MFQISRFDRGKLQLHCAFVVLIDDGWRPGSKLLQASALLACSRPDVIQHSLDDPGRVSEKFRNSVTTNHALPLISMTWCRDQRRNTEAFVCSTATDLTAPFATGGARSCSLAPILQIARHRFVLSTSAKPLPTWAFRYNNNIAVNLSPHIKHVQALLDPTGTRQFKHLIYPCYNWTVYRPCG